MDKKIIANAIEKIVDTKTILARSIFNKFRYFLSRKAIYHIPKNYIYCGLQYKTLQTSTQSH